MTLLQLQRLVDFNSRPFRLKSHPVLDFRRAQFILPHPAKIQHTRKFIGQRHIQLKGKDFLPKQMKIKFTLNLELLLKKLSVLKITYTKIELLTKSVS